MTTRKSWCFQQNGTTELFSVLDLDLAAVVVRRAGRGTAMCTRTHVNPLENRCLAIASSRAARDRLIQEMPKTILVADDSRMFRALEQKLLVEHGYRLLQAGDGAEAVRVATEEVPDLVLLDVQMPIMDGNKALYILKNSERTRHIPVLMLTAEAGPRDRQRMTEHGANGILAKPVSPHDLLSAVRAAIGDALPREVGPASP